MQQPYQVIIAEDETALATLLERLILRYYPTARVQTFGNGRDALDAYDRAGADLLFVNHGTPELDGPSFIRLLRARGDTVPIIGMSGNPRLGEEYRIAGATVFVGGAEVLDQLSALLQRFLPPTLVLQVDGAARFSW
jgi:DNA-binding response OmpR family regulator